MRRSSMRRGSAVLLSILPLLSPAYGLPTYIGNEAAATHSNVERAAVPEAAVAVEERQFSSGATSGGTSSISLDTEAANANTPNGPSRVLPHIENVSSQGSDHWLGVAPGKRDIEEREAEAEANPIISLDPASSNEIPTYDTGNLDTNPLERREAEAEAEAEASPVISLDPAASHAIPTYSTANLDTNPLSRRRRVAMAL